MRRTVTFVILLILMLVLAAFAYDRRGVQEYWLFVTRSETPLSLPLHEVSQQWREEDLRLQFPGLRLDCHNNAPGQYLGQRSCFADVTSLNGFPAMAVAFHMNGGLVDHMSVHVPWWAFGRVHSELLGTYGSPLSEQPELVGGVRLAGWKLSNGSIFVNRDRPANPLSINQVLWSSDRLCARKPCWKRDGSRKALTQTAASSG